MRVDRAHTPQADPTLVRPPLTVIAFGLANGLGVVLSPDRRAKTVTIHLRYYVGEKDDPDGKSGLAHLVEHLASVAPAPEDDRDFFERVARAGGAWANAWVS